MLERTLLTDEEKVSESELWRSSLLTATQEVLETMFFTTVIGEGSASQEIVDARTARLCFRGDPSGGFGVSVSMNSARKIAANFIGSETPDELTASEIEDVVGELANMLCGSVLSGIRSGSHFDLTHPELFSEELDVPAGAICSRIELEEGTLVSWLQLSA